MFSSRQAHNNKQTGRFEKYEIFKLNEGGIWPALKAVGPATVLSGPSAKAIEKYCNETFQEVRPWNEIHLAQYEKCYACAIHRSRAIACRRGDM